jgi:hypothetical protein
MLPKRWQAFLLSGLLVSLPVFAQAPLVRHAPWVSLVLTLGWLAFGLHLTNHPHWQLWGNLLYGFALTWLAGSLYWGWLRTDPLWHIPIEAIALPWVVRELWHQRRLVGNYFYLGSLLGTAITDLYIHAVRLLPYWRGVMQPQVTDIELERIFGSALHQMYTPWGIIWALILSLLLVTVGLASLAFGRQHAPRLQLPWFAFSGAVLSTLLVDGLFWGAAGLAANALS